MLIYLNTQTTGLEISDKMLSVGIVSEDDMLYDLVNEGKKVPSLASSINHITNEMLKGKPRFRETKSYNYLKEHNANEHILVMHNSKFDLDVLHKSSLDWCYKTIDTMRVTRHLIEECDSYSLQFLRYELKLYRREKRVFQANNALDNASTVKNLYDYLSDIASDDEMVELSQKNVLLKKFEFGKYAGRFLEDICLNDRGYMEWMLRNINDLDEDLRYSINYYLQG